MAPTYVGGGRKPVLVDYAEQSLIQAQRIYGSSTPLYGIAADASNLPIADECITSAIAVRLIQNTDQPEKMLKDIARALKPGAPLVLSYFNRRSLLRILRYGVHTFGKTHVFEHKATWGTMCGTHPAHLRKMSNDAGFAILRRAGAGLGYQVSRPLPPLARMLDKSQRLRSGVGVLSACIDACLGFANLSLWQFVLLQKTGVKAKTERQAPGDLHTILRCPDCKKRDLQTFAGGLLCGNCSKKVPATGNVYNFLGAVTETAITE
jgi:hypothetical protein